MVETRIGVDIGGTFTDVVRYGRDGSVAIQKTLSTHPGYELGVISAVERIVVGGSFEVHQVVHGTTIATNAVLERRGALTALITTRGFRDVLELRRLRMPHMYDLFWKKPTPLVERWLRFEIDERVLADGSVVRSVDTAECKRLAVQLVDCGVESVAIAFLHSHLFPEHERLVGNLLREEIPSLPITLSSDILRQEGEYERSATAVVNAYVQPLMSQYLDRISRGLKAAGVEGPLMVMQSSGGLMTSDDAKRRPVLALESGPAAGVIAALNLSRRLAYPNTIAFDMGGTTAKASLIEEGEVVRGWEYEVGGEVSVGSRLIRGSGELLRIPNIDIAEVGAGGGSLAWLDAANGLQVGPRSAGAAPGPACYGLGGTAPTVTDANVVLGYIPASPIADSKISISGAAAADAISTVATPLGWSVLDAAQGIHNLANARMMRALRSVSSERGRDPRSFALLAYGGSGPVHAATLAAELGISTVLIPPFAGVFSAVGLLFARPEFHAVRTCQFDPRVIGVPSLEDLYDSMESEIRTSTTTANIVEWIRTADLRYRGQSWEIEVTIPDQDLTGGLGSLITAFEDEHERLYSLRSDPGSPIEIRALRLVALGPRTDDDFQFRIDDDHELEGGAQEAYFNGRLVELPVLLRRDIATESLDGPLLVREYDTTVVVPPGWKVCRDANTQTLVLRNSEVV